MTIRASRGVRLLVAAAMAWLGLALCAQAAHATYGKVTIVKINKGGNQNDSFGFHPSLMPTQQDFPLKGGEQKTFQVECNNDSSYGSCAKWQHPSLTVTEQPTPGYVLESIKCVHKQGSGGWPYEPSGSSQVDGDTTVSGATIDLKVNFWEWVKCYVTNIPKPPDNQPAIHVVKDGPATAYSGDKLTFSYTLTNPGNVPLTDVTASDDKCSPLTRTGSNAGDTTLDPGDTWTYTCSYVIQHNQGDVNPVVNTVETCGMAHDTGSSGDTPVCDTDQHSTKILHPAIAIDKTGPATATAGDLITYILEVTNPGDVSFAEQLVVVTDPLCQAPPALQAKNGDSTPSALDPGDHWTYACQVQTQAGQTRVDNTATVTGTDQNGHSVSAQDTFPTTLSQPATPNQGASTSPTSGQPPQIAVSPVRVRPGSARLRGPSGCPTASAVAATVTGRRIVKVTFYVDNKKVKTLTKANRKGGQWVLPMNVKRFAFGTHRVQARIQFARSSQTPARTLRLSFNRCRPAIVTPKFTG